MAHFIQLPLDGDADIQLLRWLKAEGDTISIGDVLAELQTDKSSMELISEYEGVLLYIKIPVGIVKNGDILGVIGNDGEDLTTVLSDATLHQQIDKPNTELDIIRLPQLNDKMTEARIATWKVQEGDYIKKGDILAEVETDKAIVEIESFREGTVLYRLPHTEEVVKENQILAIVGKKGAAITHILEKNLS